MKQMDCINYFPGDVSQLDRTDLDSMLLRDGRDEKLINGFWLGGKGDNQRQTTWYYIYADGNLLGGK